MRIRSTDGFIAEARIKGKKLKPVCGDQVYVEPIENEDDWLITEILPRKNELSRPNMRGKVEVLATNIDLVIVVAAATPEPDWFIVDRYVCAAENMNADVLIIYNKTDLAPPDREFDEYQRIGYKSWTCSVAQQRNIKQIADQIGLRTAVMVGQSGVGKSSIINSLTDGEEQRTAAVSDKTSEGRHTTVNSVMLDLAGGGRIIDSPGVRDYAPALDKPEQVAGGFREIAAASVNCRFANCRHLREPDCAVKSGIEAGDISSRRYESYRRLFALTERLDESK